MRLFSRKKKNDKDFLKWFNKGYSLNESKRYEEAILCFDAAIRLNPEESMAWSNKGDSLKKLGRDEEAEQCIAKVKELKDE